jgi:hypothetical protein
MSLVEQSEKGKETTKAGNASWAANYVLSTNDTKIGQTDPKFQSQVVAQFGDLQLYGANSAAPKDPLTHVGKPVPGPGGDPLTHVGKPAPGPADDPVIRVGQPVPGPADDPVIRVGQPVPGPGGDPVIRVGQPVPAPGGDPMTHIGKPVPAPVGDPLTHIGRPVPAPAGDPLDHFALSSVKSTESGLGPGKRETAHWKVIEGGKEVEKDVPVKTWEHNGITVQIPESYRGPIKPADIFAAMDRLPLKMPVTVAIRDDQAPERLKHNKEFPITGELVEPRNDPSLKKPEIRIYPGENKLGENGEEVIRHEWTHAVRNGLDDVTKDLFWAGTMIERGVSGRPYAGTNAEENWAVHTSEEFLSPDRSRFEKLVREQPLKAALIAVTLEEQMNAHPDNSEAQREARRRCDEAVRNSIGRASDGVAGVSHKFSEALTAWAGGDTSKMNEFVKDTFKHGDMSDLDASLDNPTVKRLISGTYALLDKLAHHEDRASGTERPAENG